MERNERDANRKIAAATTAKETKLEVAMKERYDRGLSGGLALGTTLLAAGLAIAFLAFGCGKEESGTVATGAAASAPTRVARNAAATPASAPTAGVAETTPQADETSVQGLRMGTVSGDSLPPEVIASTSVEHAAPGAIVEITAEGSADVTAMTLTDGRGRTQPFTFDEASGVWRTLYRAPLQTAGDRVGLSVTAKNAANRWRRVWIFLNVGREVAPADSASG